MCMWLFYLKKNFCDGWDNMFSLAAVNAVFLAPVAILFALLLTSLSSGAELLFFVFLFLFCTVICTGGLSFGPCAVKASDFRGYRIRDCLTAIPHHVKDGLCMSAIITAMALIARVCVPFYFMRKSLLGAAVGVIFLWMLLFVILSLQWFVAVSALLPGAFFKRIKKCFILFFDNTAFSIFLALHSLLLCAFSLLFFGLLPSISGVTLAYVNALRLRLYKYDYLDAHPEYASKQDRKIIPWAELLASDKEALGPRSFKSFIFPWKE